MKKTFIGIILCAAVAVTMAGCGKKTQTPAADNNAPAVNANTVTEEDFTGTISELMKKGKPTKCTFESTSENVTQNGTVYITADKSRYDAEVTTEGKTDSIHSLKIGDTSYIWTDEQAGKGTKITMTEEEMKKVEAQAKKYQQQNQPAEIDIQQQMSFKCRAWSPDEAILSVPAGIEFQDLTAMLKQATQQLDQMNVNVCAICNHLTGEAKTQCQSMNCK
jgi:predicted small lipoprotein YifL